MRTTVHIYGCALENSGLLKDLNYLDLLENIAWSSMYKMTSWQSEPKTKQVTYVGGFEQLHGFRAEKQNRTKILLHWCNFEDHCGRVYMFPLLVYSSCGYNSWAGQTGAWSCILVSYVSGKAPSLGPFAAFPSTIAGSWVGNLAAWSQIGTLIWNAGVAN